MRERLRLYDGELHSGRRRGGGFAVRARIPLEGRVAV
jgi:signal transduction histidine kinase